MLRGKRREEESKTRDEQLFPRMGVVFVTEDVRPAMLVRRELAQGAQRPDWVRPVARRRVR